MNVTLIVKLKLMNVNALFAMMDIIYIINNVLNVIQVIIFAQMKKILI